MAERNKVLDKDYDVETQTATIKFIASGNVLEVHLSKLKPEIVTQAALHGLIQKLGDAAAGKSGDDAEDKVMGVFDSISNGDWSAAREPGEARPTFVAQAVFELKQAAGKLAEGETLETYVARYAGKDGAEARKNAMSVDAVKAKVIELQIAAKQAALAKLSANPADLGSL